MLSPDTKALHARFALQDLRDALKWAKRADATPATLASIRAAIRHATVAYRRAKRQLES